MMAALRVDKEGAEVDPFLSEEPVGWVVAVISCLRPYCTRVQYCILFEC